MNMFKSRRKAKDNPDALDILGDGQSLPTSYKTAKSLRRKNKPAPEESKPTFDLSTALPNENDFRTSLLMPNLSARFSMLREQDDPNTKLGKASDDSVLFPKRASRFNLFGHSPLADVPEIEPVSSTFVPPFAERSRAGSLGEGYDSDGGSVMNRSRPVEGNTLFGGRQKFYRVPTVPTRPAATNEYASSSKRVYEHAAPSPQFHLRREILKDSHAGNDEERMNIPIIDTEDSSEIASPSTQFSKNNRGTQSSTASAPQRSSTAATSVASESVAFRDSNGTEDGVRLQPSDGAVCVPEGDSTTSAAKAQDYVIPNRFVSPSRRNGYDRFQRPSPVFSPATLRNTGSPPTVPTGQPLDFGFKTETRSGSVTSRYQTDSPTPSLGTETDDVLASNLQPNDRGKATALGLFNKPAREFDEQQFNRRQLQMYEGQVSSMSNNSRSASRASNEAQTARQTSGIAVTSTSPTPAERDSVPRIPPIPSASASPVPSSNRASKASGRGTPTRPRSKSSASITAASNVKARVESLIRKQNEELAALETKKLGTPEARRSVDYSSANKENLAGPFFDNDEDSELGDSTGVDGSRVNSSYMDESHIHPAFRNSFRVSDGQSRKSNHSNWSRTKSIVDEDRNDTSRLQIPGIDNGSAPQQNSTGLSGLIRTHLRHDSDRSSILPGPDLELVPTPTELSQTGSTTSVTKITIDNSRVDPFDTDVDRTRSPPHASQTPLTPTSAMSQVAHQFLARAAAIRDAVETHKINDLGETNDSAEFDPVSVDRSWHDDLERKHQRGESSETTKERREFDKELANRQKKIREGLKSVTERERSQSPSAAARSQHVTMQAFVQQRAVTDPQPKAMKMLGIQGRPGSGDDDRGRSTSSRGDSRGRTPESSFSNKHTATYARFDPDTSSESSHPPRSATPPAISQGRRDRSNVNITERSKSRNRQGQYGFSLLDHQDYGEMKQQYTAASPEESDDRPEPSSNRRNGYQAPKASTPDISTRFPVRASPRPSPISPSSVYDSPVETTEVPAVPQVAGRTTANISRATSAGAFNRKRSVTKTMISEPTFLSSTSSVPLVHLPDAQQNPALAAPPLPLMNPRRRGNTTGDSPVVSPTGLIFSRSGPLAPVPASPIMADFGSGTTERSTNSPSPRKLRKANSEGGSMATKARQQAMAAERAHEEIRSLALPIFPNRSATTLGAGHDGAMF